ncbi:uncharacterized protein [Amphiura filiformis]|uniref:uncharacterized protein n=1 Tax=Amphiura filiformis TaxID=82378 RepID=UPI003B221302
MSRIPENTGSVEGLRRRNVGVNPNSEENQRIEETQESPIEDPMDDIASIELGRKPSVSSRDGDDDEDHHVSDEEEPRCDEALLQRENELVVENEQLVQGEERSDDECSVPSSIDEREESSQETAEYKDSIEQSPQDSLAEDNDASSSNQDTVATNEKIQESDDNIDDNNKEDDNGDSDDEENEIRIPLKVRVITKHSSDSGSGRSSPTNSELEVECVYLPNRMVVAAEHLRETAGHLQGTTRETAGNVRYQIGEQAEHLREQAGHFSEQIKEQVGEQAQKVVVQAERVVHKVKDVAWRVTHHNLLPEWLKDNDFLHHHHRPPLPSFRSCFKSIFRIHTETGNIWTHMIGCVTFLIMMIYFLVTSILSEEDWRVILVYMMFFIGAITCLGFSWLFHTCSCHSDKVSKIMSKLDYSGISLLIVGSFIPWLYFGFYCHNISRWFYIALIVVLGFSCLMVALKDKFAQPAFRPIRAGLFIALGLSAVIPAVHFLIIQGVVEAFTKGSFGWMLFMGALYIGGALLYAFRVPERFFPGKCDLLVQSHQIFHVMVVAAAFVHYHGLNVMAVYREEMGECMSEELEEVLPYTSGAM